MIRSSSSTFTKYIKMYVYIYVYIHIEHVKGNKIVVINIT